MPLNRLSGNRSRRVSTAARTCCRCTAPIPAGDVFVHDRGRPCHLDCAALYVRPVVANRHGGEPPRYLTGDHTGATCPGCGFELDRDADVVHVSAQPWHRSCRRGWTSTR